MQDRWPSSVWLMTGCSSGIGRAIAVAALEKGYRVVVTARDGQNESGRSTEQRRA
jgi:NAD(P)-dependent dehydrogenase (short-subunit alcohol dehydrogenase family)